jgi:hypothetical protein
MAQTPSLTLADALAFVPAYDAAESYLVTSTGDPAVRIAVYAFNDLTDGATWDTDLWDDGAHAVYWQPEGTWTSIGSRVRGLTWGRGCASPLDRPQVGTATITLENRDGEVSAWFVGDGDFRTLEGDPITPGAHVFGPPWIQAGTYILVGAFVDVTHDWKPWFTGRVEALVESTGDNVDGWLDLQVGEVLSDVGAFNGEQQTAVGAGDTLAARIARLLNDMHWQGSWTIDADAVGGAATFQATTKAQNRLAELYLTGDSVGMRVLCGSDGRVRVTTPQPDVGLGDAYTFSNNPSGDDLPIVTAQPYTSTDRVVNEAIAARIGSTEQRVQNLSSIRKRGRFDPGGSRDDLVVQTDAQVRAMLQRLVANAGDDVIGISSIEVDVDLDPINLPSVLAELASTGLEALTPFVVSWTHPSGNTLEIEVFVEGMSHSITPLDGEAGADMKWTATINTAKRI